MKQIGVVVLDLLLGSRLWIHLVVIPLFGQRHINNNLMHFHPKRFTIQRKRRRIRRRRRTNKIQKALGCKGNPLAYDITAACSGFLLGLVSAACYIRGGGFNNVLVIGADVLSRYVDWTDRGTCILFW